MSEQEATGEAGEEKIHLCTRISDAIRELGYEFPVVHETRDGRAMYLICACLEDLARKKREASGTPVPREWYG